MSTSADDTPKRVSRARAPRKTESTSRRRAVRGAARAVPAPKPEVTRPTAEERVSTNDAPVRKAPTPLSRERLLRRRQQRRVVITASIVALGVAASAGFGYTDPGVIDVDATIEARNERLKNRTATADDLARTTETIPVQNRGDDSLPNGGLRGLGIGGPENPPPPPLVVSTTTATSSESVSTSTDTASEDVVDVTEETTETSEETAVPTENEEGG